MTDKASPEPERRIAERRGTSATEQVVPHDPRAAYFHSEIEADINAALTTLANARVNVQAVNDSHLDVAADLLNLALEYAKKGI